MVYLIAIFIGLVEQMLLIQNAGMETGGFSSIISAVPLHLQANRIFVFTQEKIAAFWTCVWGKIFFLHLRTAAFIGFKVDSELLFSLKIKIL